MSSQLRVAEGGWGRELSAGVGDGGANGLFKVGVPLVEVVSVGRSDGMVEKNSGKEFWKLTAARLSEPVLSPAPHGPLTNGR